MSDVTGPISTLPGTVHRSPDGAMCDDHPTVRAAGRLQGETDSFGSEMHDLCQACLDEAKKHREDDRCGFCDWCKSEAKDLRDRRDYEEGMAGRVYRVCGACVRRENNRLNDELEELGYFDDYGDD